jgi:hypothetical protein
VQVGHHKFKGDRTESFVPSIPEAHTRARELTTATQILRPEMEEKNQHKNFRAKEMKKAKKNIFFKNC